MLNGSSRSQKLLPIAAAVLALFGYTQESSAATLIVTECGDSGGPGTLRSTVAAATRLNDTIDIPATVCSKITLANPIVVTQDSLTINGPGADKLTISGGADANPPLYHQIFFHNGSGTLTISNVTLAESKYKAISLPRGGCIYSSGNVSLSSAVVTSCQIAPTTSVKMDSQGGAISALGRVILNQSTVTGNSISSAPSHTALGAGIFAGAGLTSNYSIISDNSNFSLYGTGGGIYEKSGTLKLTETTVSGNSAYQAGGIFVGENGGNSIISYTTISGNAATINGGFDLHASDSSKTVTIVDSTVSGNVAALEQGGGATYASTYVFNSTIAFNRVRSPDSLTQGLYSSAPITMQSSIFANNGSNDVSTASNVPLTGAGNLITSTTLNVPLDTITSCPRLGPLVSNGGTTATHALLAGSPAIDKGNLNFGAALPLDQRHAPRTAGPATDIGAYERQPGELDDRVFQAEFEARCD